MLPRLTPRALPDSAAQVATNARLLSGDLEAWRQFALTHTLAMSAPVGAIYKLNSAWLSWAGDVDAARGPVPGDTTFRLFLTGPAVYSTPSWTNYAMATAGAEPYPVTVRPLGVPAPTGLFFGAAYYPASGVDRIGTTSYVLTYVNDVGQESAPSSPTLTITAPSGLGDSVQVAVTPLSSGISAAYGITTVRIYRAATGSTGTAFRFVGEMALPVTFDHFIDDLADSQLGEVLPSALWDLPPDDLQGIIALPNGVMAGFSKNNLCLSAQNFPHAWPVDYQLTTDTDIVGIGNIDTTIVVFTQSFLYVASGADPAQYSMAKFEIPRAGVAKRSIAYLRETGVIGATSLGLAAVQGVGQMQNLTESIFTYQQWQALVPSSIIAFGHNNVYFFFYDTGSAKGGYALDMSPTGFGLVALSFHATAGYNDPQTDQLFLVLDQVNEPTDAHLTLASTAPTPNGHTVYEFDAPTGSGRLVYKYRGKFNDMARPAAFQMAQLRANDFANVVLNLYANGSLLAGLVITNATEFTLPCVDEYTTFEIEIVGTSSIRDVQAVEIVDELGIVSATQAYSAT